MTDKKPCVLMIPGFGEYPETKTFSDLRVLLENSGYTVSILAWPHYPNDLANYSFTETLAAARESIKEIRDRGQELILHGNSMGGILAILLAKEFAPKKLSLTVTPYQAGTNDDLAGKYREWKEAGFREFTSSKYGVLRIPFSFIEDARQYNALNYIQDVQCPVFFVAGMKDQNVPWSTTKRLYDLANEPKEWHLIDGMEHRFQYQPEKLEEVNTLLVKFLLS